MKSEVETCSYFLFFVLATVLCSRDKETFMKFAKSAAALALGAGAALLLKRSQQNSYNFGGTSVLITGGSRGLGLILARQFADEGARLTLVARDEAELGRAADELRQRGTEVLTIVADVRNQEEAQSAVKAAVTHYGRIDVLVNVAGIISIGPLEHQQIGDFEDSMATHFWGPLYTMFAAIPFMREQGGGRVVNIASIGGRVAVPHMAPYSSSKFALVGLSDSVRNEVYKDNIYVTTVCPGIMRTGSHVNAMTKGQHKKEFTWFAMSASTPGISMDAERAAHQIVEACRRGAAHLTISLQAQILGGLNGAFPDFMGALLRQSYLVMPAPTGPQGDRLKKGYESRPEYLPEAATYFGDKAAEKNNEIPPRPVSAEL
jgi:short-subunit dehydrogenase